MSLPNFVATTNSSDAARERLSHDALARAQSVDVGGVEERDAGVDGSGDDCEGRLTIDPATEVVAAESHAGDDEGRATEAYRLHPPIVVTGLRCARGP